MRRINALLKANRTLDKQFNQLANQADRHLDLQQFWQAIAPQSIARSSHVALLKNKVFIVYAHNSSVAAKIKLMNASLLTQLQDLQKKDPFYKPYDISEIRVKMQVKSQQMPKNNVRRVLSRRAASTLRHFATSLGDSALADKLHKLADNA